FPLQLFVDQTVTLGAEWNRDELNDPASMQSSSTDFYLPGSSGDPSQRSSKNSATISSLYFEDNIAATDSTEVIPGLRFDYHDNF
ncbi:TonB-dependent receptor, partial [Klebsiella oxytoca]